MIFFSALYFIIRVYDLKNVFQKKYFDGLDYTSADFFKLYSIFQRNQFFHSVFLNCSTQQRNAFN